MCHHALQIMSCFRMMLLILHRLLNWELSLTDQYIRTMPLKRSVWLHSDSGLRIHISRLKSLPVLASSTLVGPLLFLHHDYAPPCFSYIGQPFLASSKHVGPSCFFNNLYNSFVSPSLSSSVQKAYDSVQYIQSIFAKETLRKFNFVFNKFRPH